MKRIYLVAAIMTFAILFAAIAAPVRAADGDEAKLQVAQKFLRAYLLKNDDVLPYITSHSASMFGPYPFKSPLQFNTPKVHGNQAIMEFSGTTIDGKFPSKGGILFYNHNYKWHVRQVFFYDHIPNMFGLPTKSVNAKDRSFEPEVKAMGESFMAAWERGEREKMLVHWWNWPKMPGDPVKGLHMSNLNMNVSSTAWGDAYVSYSVKMTYRWGILSYSMTLHGGLVLVQENGAWKVRGNVLVFAV